MRFRDIYSELNDEQKEAVKPENLDGPMLVIAGPGTGKTHLLSARVASILENTDVGPENILCLTFTSSGADNMRERLNRFVGEASYKVTISTYHEFGSLLIRSNPEYFRVRELKEPTDVIMTHKILKKIKDELSYNDPLWYMEEKTLGKLIRDARLALLSPDDLETIATENEKQIELVNEKLNEVFDPSKKMSSKLSDVRPQYEELKEFLDELGDAKLPGGTVSLASYYSYSLAEALENAELEGKAKPLNGGFKSAHITKDADGKFILKATKANKRVKSLADIYKKYLDELELHGLYDYDDMILETVRALERSPDFKADLQERYQYILLDEYQDTNAAQSRIVELLADSPMNEGRPNVVVVGDDDQAIYAFQGALSSNLKEFYDRYENAKQITLVKNYRSADDIISFSKNIANKIEDRIAKTIGNIDKTLIAAGKNIDYDCEIERITFKSTETENAWVAKKVKDLVDSGIEPSSIAILARNNKELSDFAEYLDSSITVSYERSENILTDSKPISELLLIAKLIVALDSNQSLADELWPEVLSLDMWKIDLMEIWKVSWTARDEKITWSEALAKSEDPRLQEAARLVLMAGIRAKTETMERMIDLIVGTDELDGVRSPMRQFYLESGDDCFYELVSHLSVLRSRLKNYVKQETEINLANLINFVQDCFEAGANIGNTSPYNESSDAVNLMTAHKAKGLEWDYVFVISATNQNWVRTGSQGGSHLPVNLTHIHPSGDRDDDQKRLLFVALTRARHHLYITNPKGEYSGKRYDAIEFFDERPEEDHAVSHTLPDRFRIIREGDEGRIPTIENLQAGWRNKHAPVTGAMKNLLRSRLKKLKLSPTHISTFLDPEYGGPKKFYENSLLLFPQCMTEYNVFGNCVHKALEMIQKEVKATGRIPDEKIIFATFDEMVEKTTDIDKNTRERMREHARELFPELVKQRSDMLLMPNIEVEIAFGNEGIMIDGVPINGRIDRIEIDREKKTMTVVDFKTGKIGKPGDKKSYKNQLQIYFYKLLVENSVKFRGYTVTGGRIEYIDPDKSGRVQMDVIEKFENEEMEKLRRLIRVIWDRVQRLEFPDVSEYVEGIEGMRAFEEYLLEAVEK